MTVTLVVEVKLPRARREQLEALLTALTTELHLRLQQLPKGTWSVVLDFEPVPTCRKCGCTDAVACEGGCWWAKPGLCSSCAPKRRKQNASTQR